MNLPLKVRNKLDNIVFKSRDYVKIISQGNPKQVAKIVNNVINMTETFYECISTPCMEICKFSSLLRQSYHQLHIRSSILD